MVKHYDLVVIGAGSGNMVFGPEFDGWTMAVVESDRFGGTCLNRGCIPSKMFVVTADLVQSVRHAARLGVDAEVRGVDWPAVRDRVFGRIDPIHEQAVGYRRRSGVDVFQAPARFVGPKTIDVDGEAIRADQIVVAAGSRPILPPIAGITEVPVHTSDTIMRLDELPRSMLIIGGGFIAAELGHVFEAFGVEVAIVQRGDRLLTAEDREVADAFTENVADRFDLHLGSEVVALARDGDGVRATVRGPHGEQGLRVDLVLVAAGRRPNTDLLDVAAGGLEVDDHGHLVTDRAHRTTVPGVWAMGDVANHFQLKHLANAEMRTVRHNLLGGDTVAHTATNLVPHAVFADPQIAAVGLTEQQAVDEGVPHVVARRRYADTAYGWALEDTTGFVKLLADPQRRVLLGAHIMGPQAATLLQPLLQAMTLGQTIEQLARDVLYVHPALTEVLEQALLEL